MMRKIIVGVAILLLLLGFSGQSMAEIHIGVNIPLPPAFVFSAPPELVVVPGTYVYYSPDVNFDLFFYGGYWYRPYNGYWYRSVNYGGPWAYIERPPSVLVSLPPNYRIIAREGRHIPYSELHRNWRAWQREKYWEHHNWGRLEHERSHGLAPSYREGEHGRYQGAAPQSKGREHEGYHSGVHEGSGYHGQAREGHERH